MSYLNFLIFELIELLSARTKDSEMSEPLKKSNQPIIKFATLAFLIQRFECTRVHVQAGSLSFEKSLKLTKTLLKNKIFLSFFVFFFFLFPVL